MTYRCSKREYSIGMGIKYSKSEAFGWSISAKTQEKMGGMGKMDGGAKTQVGGKRVFFGFFIVFLVRFETIFCFFLNFVSCFTFFRFTFF